MLVERAGFFGRWGLGGIYELNRRHSFELSVGNSVIEHKDHYQANLSYRYSQWEVVIADYRWLPFQVGMFTMYSLDQSRYFLESPGKYPSPGYYDGTALRSGIDFATTLIWMRSSLGVAYHLRVLDSGVVAIYNNKNRDLQYYISSGISLRYLF